MIQLAMARIRTSLILVVSWVRSRRGIQRSSASVLADGMSVSFAPVMVMLIVKIGMPAEHAPVRHTATSYDKEY